MTKRVKFIAKSVDVYYGEKHALYDVTIDIFEKEVLALIGPSGCGKSTFIRCLNRINDEIETCHVKGSILLDGIDINSTQMNVFELRRKVGIVFQKPTPFPRSIFDNIAYGPRIHGIAHNNKQLASLVEESLHKAALLDDVKDRLDEPALSLSGGQQQRLCIARALAVNPEVILMDEPCSALDPIATARIESLIDTLGKEYTIIVVTHSMQQAARISQRTAFFHVGKLVECDDTDTIFTHPTDERTHGYITGRFG